MVSKWILFAISIMVTPGFILAQDKRATTMRLENKQQTSEASAGQFMVATRQLTLKAAYTLTEAARAKATAMGRQVSIAVVDQSGVTILLSRGDGVGPHNTEAARRKAYTALSTKTSTFTLARNAKANRDSENLAFLPELLLLGGGVPLWHNGDLVGSIGVAGGGSAENDHIIAQSANSMLPELL